VGSLKRIKIIYNPDSGKRALKKSIPELVEILTNEFKYKVDKEPTLRKNHASELAYNATQDGYDLIIAAGGDGTVNEVVNGMMANSYRPKLAIYPAGTMNDFANYLQIPRAVEEFTKIIMKNNIIKTDVGLGGDRYFLNVAAAGLLTDVAYKVSSESKTILGKFAYYLEGIKEIPKQIFKPIKIRMRIGDVEQEREVLFFILANSASVGGFKYIAPEASINDGKFDLLIVEKGQYIDAASIFVKALIGNHTTHPNLKYIQVDELSVECDEDIYIDLDGEQAGKLPMNFRIKKEAIELIVP